MRPIALFLPLLASLFLLPASAGEKPERIELKEGMTFPILEGTTHTGEAFTLADYLNRDQYILVDFWAGWCGPCMQQMPYLSQAMREVQNERFAIVTVSLDDENSKPRLEKAIEDFGLTFPIVTDWQRWKSRYVSEYGVYGIPANFLISPEGVVLMRNLHDEDLVDIPRLFAEDPDLHYEPILIDLEITNMPPRVSAELPEIEPAPLEIVLQVDNPQIEGRAFEAGIIRTAYVDTGVQTLRRRNGAITKDVDGNPIVFQVIEVVEEEFQVTLDASQSTAMSTALAIPIPEGTLDATLTPYTWSPVLGRRILGKAQYPSYSIRYGLPLDDVEAQGGIIDPATYEGEG